MVKNGLELQTEWLYSYLIVPHICLLQGSGSEERPDSPSDSLDGTKKGERKKEFVCQVRYSCPLALSRASNCCHGELWYRISTDDA